MDPYVQLTCEERYQIWALRKAGKSTKTIAEDLGRHPSTLYRELNRNRGKRGYRPKQAQQLSEKRNREGRKAFKFTAGLRVVVEAKLRLKWSPEQIGGWLRKHRQGDISHERIYQYVLEDKRNGGDLYTHLRWARRKRRKRCPGPERRGQIRNRVGIEKRPRIVDQKRRRGDWEGDTVIGKGHHGALVTLVERKSKYTLIRQVERRTAEAVSAAIIAMVAEFKDVFKTLTLDNGKEFAAHETISKKLQADVYFARPYHSWERGLNENTNGLIRQFFPKQTDFRTTTNAQVAKVQELLNHRPRKTIGWLTPHEVLVQGKYIRVQSTI